ncbi:MAG TPA: prenyltransferase [bacterium]|nr:prenyltransferase [bacterium]
MGLLKNWKAALDTGNIPEGAKMDFIGKWLVITRAAVFSMTITSVLIGVILAAGEGYFKPFYAALVLAALILAHASNNLINDYFDYKLGTDTPDYHRTQYSPHPIISGLITEKGLLAAFFIFGIIELGIAVYLFVNTGWPVIALALAGFLLSVFYVAPPLKLKYRGAGEFAIFLIWGPMITAGTYYVMAESAPLFVWLASIPYGLVVMNVLLGKHLDKFDKDKEKGVKTLPVVLGKERAVAFTKVVSALFFITVALLVFFRAITPFALICFFAARRFRVFLGVLSAERPEKPPEGFPNIWPLWYVVWAFWFNKLAGGLFITGLIIGAVTKRFFGF